MKRIFIVSQHPLFSRGVETLLDQKSDFELVGIEENAERAIESIKRLDPDVVILDSNYTSCNSDPMLMRIFQEQSGIQVIGLNLQDNRICIYHSEQRTIHQVEDLCQVIQNNSSVAESAKSGTDLHQRGGDQAHIHS